MIKKLTEIELGKTVIIDSIENDEIFLKLLEMGCLPGEEITIEHRAPLGDPLSVLVAGYSLSLRKDEAEMIWVTNTNI